MKNVLACAMALVWAVFLPAVGTPANAEGFEIDMEGLPPGTIVFELQTGAGVDGDMAGKILVFGYNPAFGFDVNAAVIFDSSNPTGGDFDLGTPNEDFGGPGSGAGGEAGSPFENSVALGNIMVVAENLDDLDSDGLVDDPDDADKAIQGVQFLFTDVEGGTVTVNSVTYMDVEAEQGEDGAYIQLFGPDIPTQLIAMPPTGNNGVLTLDGIGISGVSEMRVVLAGSGAIAGAVLDARVERDCWVTTGGFYDASIESPPRDCSFGGNIGPSPSGVWVAHNHDTGNHFYTHDIWLTSCSATGTTGPGNAFARKGFDIDRADFECTGRLNEVDGYACHGFVIDGGEPSTSTVNDPDHFEIYVTDGAGNVVFECVGDLDRGNVQIHPPVVGRQD